MKQKAWIYLGKIENNKMISAIRQGLIMIIPVLMMGSFSLIFETFPLEIYLNFIKNFGNGVILEFLDLMYNATFGMQSIYIVFAISLCYGKLQVSKVRYIYGPPITAIICFFVLVGSRNVENLYVGVGAQGMFTAIFAAIVASMIYIKIFQYIGRGKPLFTDGADVEFNDMLAMIGPAFVTVAIFVIFNMIIVDVFKVGNFQEFYSLVIDKIFLPMGRNIGSGCLFVILSSLLWFFGIHGGDVLEGVSEQLFTVADTMNQNAVLLGQQPSEIITKTFLDVFVLMGGCGSTICLLFALILFSKRRGNKQLAKMAIVPMTFNINEMIVFGLPIIYNPILFIPFLLTPIVLFFVSYCAIAWGLVPPIIETVKWTTPIVLGGYTAVGSISGSILQLVNVGIGLLIYRPFVKIYDQEQEQKFVNLYQDLVDDYIHIEKTKDRIRFTEQRDAKGALAKHLFADLKRCVELKELNLCYQPQYNNKGECTGAEALLRWNHKMFGMIYPPLVIKLAQETGYLEVLEQYIVRRGIKDTKEIQKRLGRKLEISINVSGGTIQSPSFEQFLVKMYEEYKLTEGDICIEITEQEALMQTEDMENLFERIRRTGFKIAIDDFSMGHTSLKYLQSNQFDLVKLDGGIVKDMINNQRSREIISSIVYLSQSLGFTVLAEYVETEEMRIALERLGCMYYQGYLYSPAISKEKLVEKIDSIKNR